MKNIPIVLIILMLSMPVYAQDDAVKTTGQPVYNNIVNPKLKSFSGYEIKQPGFIHTNKQPDFKRFIELYNKKQLADKTTSRRLTFMDGPVVFSPTAVEASGSQNPLGLRPVYITGTPSTALEILGFAAGIFAPALAPRNHLPTQPTPMQAYLQSTYRQHQ